MQTPNIADKNFEILSKMFPNAITETINENGEVVRAIDADVLRQEISCSVVEGKDERYQFTWPDKKKAISVANASINATLRPSRSESKSFDNTENLYIEGDNLDALKLLQETYLEKIKVIYIDPPYNTGSDFVYDDDYSESVEGFVARSGQYDDAGNRLVQNVDSNGRYHTDWLNMIYTRLRVAKNLLCSNGFIFISIDENEFYNLKKIANEIFGEKNAIGTFIWRKKDGGGQAKEAFVIEHEYILVYCKSDSFSWLDKTEMRGINEFNKEDGKGKYKITKLAKWGNTARREDRPSMYFPLTAPDNSDVYPIAPDGGDGRWRVGAQRMDEIIKNDLIHWEKKDGQWIPYEKEYFENQYKVIKERSILYKLANTGDGSNVLTSLFGKKDTFENPKPVELIKLFLSLTTKEDDIIMDFFGGSSTTAHAVMELNSEDEGSRRFILVQVPEECDEKSEAYKSGYKTICEIGKERIRRAGDLYSDKSIDTGFRVLKIDSSNMKDVYYNPAATQQTLMDFLSDNIKEDRTSEDLLFQVMLDLGVLLSSKIEETEIAGKKVFSVADDFLIACFDTNVTEETVKAIAAKKPYYAVFRDSSMASDSVATNFDQIFATISPETVRKVL